MNLQRLIQEGEHEQQDFKEAINSSRKIAKTIVSFANTRGGRIIVGVRDNRTIKGIQPAEEKHMLDTAAGFFCKPPIELTYEVLEEGNKKVLVATVPDSINKPHYAQGDDDKWWVYIRVKDESLLASKTVVDVLRRGPRNTFIEYGEKEKALLNFLQNNDRVTLKQFCKLVNISTWRARKILVNLVSAGVVRVHHTEKVEFYTL